MIFVVVRNLVEKVLSIKRLKKPHDCKAMMEAFWKEKPEFEDLKAIVMKHKCTISLEDVKKHCP